MADPTPAGTGAGEPSEVKPRGPTTHDLKTWPVSYAAVASGRKCFELRKADRDFRTGDYLRLREYAMDGYTGDELLVGPVQYIAEVGAWVDVPEPFVVLGFPSHRAAPVAADARPADVDALAHALRHLPDVELHNDPVIIAADLLARVVLPSADARPEAGERDADERAVLTYAARRLRSEAEYGPDEQLNETDRAMARLLDVMAAATPPGAASGTRAEVMEEAARIAEWFDAFTGASYCDEQTPGYQRELAHDYGRGGCQVRRMIAEELRRRAAVPPPSGEPE